MHKAQQQQQQARLCGVKKRAHELRIMLLHAATSRPSDFLKKVMLTELASVNAPVSSST
jgi:hypothetical protein